MSPATRLGPRSLILGGIAAAADAAATATNFDTAAPASHRPLRRPNPAPGVAPPPLPPSLLQMRRALSLKTPKSVRFADEVSVKTFKREGGEMAKDAVSEGTKADTKKTDTFCRREWMSNPNFARQTKKILQEGRPRENKSPTKALHGSSDLSQAMLSRAKCLRGARHQQRPAAWRQKASRTLEVIKNPKRC